MTRNILLFLMLIILSITDVYSQASNQISTTGNVGIGTLTPLYKLEVKDGDFFINNTSTDGGVIRSTGHYLDFKGATDNSWAHRTYRFYPSLGVNSETHTRLELYQGYTDGSFVNKVSVSSDGYTFFNGGNVGIGTDSPSSKLSVNGGISVEGINSIPSVNGFNNMIQLVNANHAAIVYNPGQTSELMFGMHSDGNFYWGTGANSSAGMKYSMVLGRDGWLSLQSLIANTSLNVGNKLIIDSNDIQFNQAGNACYISNIGSNGSISFTTGGGTSNVRMTILGNGNVGIGTTNTGSCKLAVEGTIGAREVVVKAPGVAWPDYVFNKDYKLPNLEEVESYVAEKKHLPDVPSAEEVSADGVNLAEMNAILLKKVEELTLHLIELKKEVELLKASR